MNKSIKRITLILLIVVFVVNSCILLFAKEKTIAKVGPKAYSSLQDAISACPRGGTVIVTGKISTKKPINMGKKTFTIDFQKYKL